MANKKGTVYVITCFEKSRDYLFSVLDNAPTKYRYSFVRKIEQMLLDIDECLRMANRTRLEMEKARVGFQEKAKRKINVLCSLLRIAAKQGCIAFSHYDQATKLLSETLLYLDKWIESDKARRSKLPNPSL